ncbi:MAG TPA: hypothetical protein VK390_12350 [Propionibacteriaceae bacterium]|nr:hypothetical protein [Propionibacteriaceae bacterium]
MRDASITNHQTQLAISGQTLTIDVNLVRTEGHLTVELESGQRLARRFLEARGVDIQYIDQQSLNVLDRGGCGGRTGTDLLCGAQYTRQIADSRLAFAC